MTLNSHVLLQKFVSMREVFLEFRQNYLRVGLEDPTDKQQNPSICYHKYKDKESQSKLTQKREYFVSLD